MTLPRIPLPGWDELNEATQAQLGRRPPVALYRMVAHAPTLLAPFMSMVLANFDQLSLPAPLREAIILRVGAHHRSAYEIHHHRIKAREVGLGEDCMTALLLLRQPSELPLPWLPEPIELTDALVQGRVPEEGTVRRVVAAWQHRGYVEIAMLVGFYRMVATFIEATGLQPELDASA